MYKILSFVRLSTLNIHLKASKLKWYKSWHEKKYSSGVHKATLLAFVVSLFVFVGLQMSFPLSFSLNGRGVVATQQKIGPKDATPIAPSAKIRTYMKNVKNVGDGKIQAEVYDHPVQYLDTTDGQWKDIDTSLKTKNGNKQDSAEKISGKKDKEIFVNTNTLTSSFSTNPTLDLTVSTDGGTITTAYLDANTTPGVVSGNTILYSEVYSKTDVERIVLAGEVKQNIILKETGHPTVIREKLETTLRVEIQPDNSLNYYKGNDLVASTPAIFITDADGAVAAVDLKYENNVLQITLPKKLRRLTYPLIIDPTISVNPVSADDGYVTKTLDSYGVASYAKNTSATADLANGVNSNCTIASTSCNRTFIRFSLAGLGPISAATINTYGQSASSTGALYHTAPFALATDAASTVWGLATDSGQTFTNTLNTLNTHTVTASVSADYNASRAYTYFAIYAGASGASINTYSVDNATNKPYLSVTYLALPAAPTTFNGTALSSTSMRWGWTDSSTNETGFLVHDGAEVSKSGAIGSTSVATTGTAYTWDETTGLAANTQYSRHAHASNADGNSTTSNIVSKYTLPNIPTGLMVTPASSSQLNVSWTAPTGGANHYHLFRGVTQVGGDIATTSYNDTSLTANTQYSYTVKAVNADNAESTATGAIAKYTLTNVPASASSSAPSTTQINISWTAPSVGTASSYHVKSSSDAYASNKYNSTGLSFSETALSPNTQYTYRVYGVNSDGVESATYATTACYTWAGAATTPAASAASASQMNVTWTAPAGGANHYHVRSSSDAFATIKYDNSAVTSWNETALTANTQYTYRIYSVNADNVENTGYVNTAAKYTFTNVPTGLSVTAPSSTQLNASWITPTGGASAYHLYRGLTQIGGDIIALSFGDSGLAPNTQYTYTVKAVNSDGIEGAATAGVAKYTLTGAPASTSVLVPGATQLDVSWTAPSVGTVTSYHVKSSSDGFASNKYSSTGLAYSETLLTPNTQYTYRVYGVNGDGTESAAYASAAKYTLTNVPASISATATSTSQIDVSWTAPASGGVASYHLKSSSDGYTTNKYSSTGLTWSETLLAVNSQYTYRVYGANADGTESTTFATVSKYTWTNVPTGQTAAAISATQVNVIWSAPATGGVNHYHIRSSSDAFAAIKYDSTTTSWNETGLTGNTTYTYRIYAVNSDNAENTTYVSTAPVNTWVGAPTAPNAVANSSTQINVSWSAPGGGANHYHVRSSSDTYASIKYDSTATNWNESALAVNTSYTYRIYAVNIDNVENTNYVSVTRFTLSSDPSVLPSSTTWTSNPAVTFTNQATGLSKYKYIWNQNASTPTWAGTETDWVLPGALNLTMVSSGNYYLHLLSYNGDAPAVAGAKTDYEVGPFQFDNVGPTGTTLTWDTIAKTGILITAAGATDSQSNIPAAAYYIERDNGATTFVAADANSGWITGAWSQTGLSQNMAYSFRVKSRDNLGNESGWVTPTPAYKYTLASAPDAPTVANVALSTTSLNVVANEAGNPSATQYAIQEAGGQYVQTPVAGSASLGASQVWLTAASWGGVSGVNITGLAANTQYSFSMKAKSSDGTETLFSNSTSKYTLIQIPTGLNFGAIDQTQIATTAVGTLSNLTMASSALYFENTTTATNSGWTQTNAWSSTTLSANTQYSLRVKARNAEGTETAFTALSSKYTMTNAPISQAALAISTAQVNVTWSAPAGGAARYHVRSSSDGYASIKYDNTTASWNETGLTGNTAYTYRIFAVNADLLENPAYVVTTPESTWVNAPTGQNSAAASTTQMSVSWLAAAGGADHYHVKSSSDGFTTLKFDDIATSFSETGLAANTSYTYRIYSVSSSNVENTNYVITAAKYTWPNEITAGASIANSSTQMNTSWTAPVGGTAHYHVRSSSDAYSSIKYDNSSVTAWNETGLVANTAYVYRIYSVNADNVENTNYYATASKLTWPNTPTAQTATASSTVQIDVAWSAPTNGSNHYHIRSSSDSFATIKYNGAGTTWNENGLTFNTSYTYRIYSVNADNVENPVFVTVSRYTWPSAPTAQSAVAASTTQMNVSWTTGNGGTNHYHVRSSSDGYAVIKYDNVTSSWNEVGLSANNAYIYHIYAVNADNVENTVFVATLTKNTLTNAPAGQAASAASSSQIDVTWSAPSGGSSRYHVRSSLDAFATVKYDDIATNWSETGLSANTSYLYRIYGVNVDGVESATFATTIARYTFANDPSISPASGQWTNNSTVTFTNLAAGVGKYKYVWDQNTGTPNWSGSEADWNLLGTLATNMTVDGEYYLHLRSYNSDSPAVASPTTNYRVGPFQYDNVVPTGVSLNWGAVSNNTISVVASGATDTQSNIPVAAYYIERDDNAATFVTANANSGWISGTWDQTGLSANVAYAYRVKAKDNAGNESPWVTASVTSRYTLSNAPILNIPSSTSTNDNRPQLTNSSTPDLSFRNRLINLYEGAVNRASTTANSSGVFTFGDSDFATNLSEGAHTLTVKSTNTSDIESAVSGALTIFVDSVSPTTSLLTGSVTPGVGGWYTINPIISLEINDSLPSGGNGISYFKWDDASFLGSTQYTGDINMNSTAGQGIHTLYWRSIDAAGNSEAVKSQEFKLDSVTPSGEVTITSGMYSTLNPVIINMTAADVTSGLNRMYVSNSGLPLEFCDYDFATNHSLVWDLSGATNPNCGTANTEDGSKAVYVKFSDLAGNTSIAYTATTVLDRTNPINSTEVLAYSIPSQSTADITSSAWTHYANPKFVWNGATDNASGIKGYWVYFGTDQNAEPMMATDSNNLAYTDNGNNNFFEPADHNSYVVTSHMVSGLTYYLKVRAQDNAMYNAAANYLETQNNFVYKYDGGVPTPISYVRTIPAGYSSIDNYTFEWDPVSDSISGLDKYQYRRDNGSDGWTDMGMVPDPITGKMTTPVIQHYKEDDNLLEVRAVDKAGNVSTVTRALYYYAGVIPAPNNLQVRLDESQNQSVNRFSFTWDKAPTTDIQGYYFSVNSQPNAQNSTFIAASDSDSSIQTPYAPFATARGLNQFWVATKARGTVGWQSAVLVEFSCNTSAPGIPTNVLITDSSNRDAQRWQLTVNWNEPADTTPDFNGYTVERSTDNENWQEMQTTRVKAIVDTDLLNTVTYYYRVYAKDSIGNKSAASSIVSMLPTGKYTIAPSLIGTVKADAQATKVRVSWTTDRDCDSFVQIGVTDRYGLTQGQLDSTGAHYVQINGLTPGTVYHYSAIWRDVDGNIGHSNDQTFRTLDAPSISEVTVSDVRLNSAIVSWKSSTIASSQVLYGKDYKYGSVAADESSSAVTVHVIKLDSLDHSSSYHFKIVSIDVDGNAVTSDDYSFDTLKFPILSDIKMEQLKDMPTSTIRVTWDSNIPTTSVVSYSEIGGNTKESAKSVLEIKHSITISNLRDNTSYRIAVSGRDQYGTEPVANGQTVKTEFDTRPPVISNITTETSVVGFGSDARTQVIVSWETDEPSTSQIEYDFGTFGESFQFKTQEDAGLATTHVVILSGLKPSTSYHFRALSRDAAKNAGYSDDDTILTEQASSSILDIIVNSLQNSLGWLFGSFSRK